MRTSEVVRPASPVVESMTRQGRIWTAELEQFAQHRVGNALSRFDRRIQSISVSIEDVNGPRGGIDKRCRIDVRLQRKGRIVVTATAENAHAAIAKAAMRVRAVLVRSLERRRTARLSKTAV